MAAGAVRAGPGDLRRRIHGDQIVYAESRNQQRRLIGVDMPESVVE